MPFFRRKSVEASATPTKAEIAAAVTRPEEFETVESQYESKPSEPKHPVPGESTLVAPMFVKVEKYRDIITELGELRNFIGSIKQIFSVLSDLETTREDALKIMRAAIQRMEKAVAAIDSEFVRPVGFEAFPHGEIESRHIETTLTSLQQQLSALHRELEGYKS